MTRFRIPGIAERSRIRHGHRQGPGRNGYIAAQGKPYLLRPTSSGSTLSFTQWDAVTIPPAPAASQIVDPSKLTG